MHTLNITIPFSMKKWHCTHPLLVGPRMLTTGIGANYMSFFCHDALLLLCYAWPNFCFNFTLIYHEFLNWP